MKSDFFAYDGLMMMTFIRSRMMTGVKSTPDGFRSVKV